MGQLVSNVHRSNTDLYYGFISAQSSLLRSRQVLATSFDACKTIAVSGSGSTQDQTEIGEIKVFGFPYSNPKYKQCNGDFYDPAVYVTLFQRIGHRHGTHANGKPLLPNLIGKSVEGAGIASQIGQQVGNETFFEQHVHNISVTILDHNLDGVFDFDIEVSPTNVPLSLSVTGTAGDTDLGNTYPLSISADNLVIDTDLDGTGNTNTLTNADIPKAINDHEDTVTTNGHLHDITTNPVRVAEVLEGGRLVAAHGTYTSTPAGDTINLDLEHVYSISHDVNVTVPLEINQPINVEGTVDIDLSHGHSVTGTATGNANHGHSANSEGVHVFFDDVEHSVTITEDEYNLNIPLRGPRSKEWFVIKVL